MARVISFYRTIRVALLVTAMATACGQTPAGWALTAPFPETPRLTRKPSGPGIKYFEQLNLRFGEEFFGLHRIRAEAEGAPDDLGFLYQTMKKTMLNARPSTLLEEETITVDGRPALRYVLSYDNGRRKVEFRDVLIKSKNGYEGYLAMCDYVAAKGPSEHAIAFFAQAKVRDVGDP